MAEEKASKPVAISPAALSADDLATLLDAHVWKFDLTLPTNTKDVSIRLELSTKGRGSTQFGTGLETPVRGDVPSQVIVGIIPLGGSKAEVEKVRVVLLTQGGLATGVEDNPLRKMSIGRPATGSTPTGERDGSYVLIGGYEGGSVKFPVAERADKFISLHILPKP